MTAPTTEQRLKVKLVSPAKTSQTGIILPAGSVGYVLAYQRSKNGGGYWVVDFGLMTVINLPVNSPLVSVLNGGR